MMEPTLDGVPITQASAPTLEAVLTGTIHEAPCALHERLALTRAIAHRLLMEKLGLR